jgi:tetratricopeptide (TPR) repeat protein
MLAYAGLQDVIMNGIELRDIALPYFQLSAKTLQLKQDSLLQEILMGQVPRYIFNQAAYQSLQKKQLDQALGFAKLQAMLLPTDPNSWDTLGEVYYFLGQKEIAVSYETIRKKIDPKSEGGLIAWESDLKEYQGIWAANQIP